MRPWPARRTDARVEVDDGLSRAVESADTRLLGAVSRGDHRSRHVEAVRDPALAHRRPAGRAVGPQKPSAALPLARRLDAALHADARDGEGARQRPPQRATRRGLQRHERRRRLPSVAEDAVWSEQQHVTQLLPAARQRVGHGARLRGGYAGRFERGESRAAHLRVDAARPRLVQLDEPDRHRRLLELELGAGKQRERDAIVDLLRAPRNVQLARAVERAPRPLGLRRRDDGRPHHRHVAKTRNSYSFKF